MKTLWSTQPKYVVVASALKQIDLCEREPWQCLQTNVVGLSNVLEECHEVKSQPRVVFVSTDKACDPVNVYGSSKAFGERMTLAANMQSGGRGRFCAVRYGNVFGSTGSIYPLIQRWVAHGETFKLTHPEMTRFLMTSSQAVHSVFAAAFMPKDGVFIPDLSSQTHRVMDLMDIYRGTLGIDCVGIRPGEKLHESLMTPDEAVRAVPWSLEVRQGETISGWMTNGAWLPESRPQVQSMKSSDGLMTREQLALWLTKHGYRSESHRVEVSVC